LFILLRFLLLFLHVPFLFLQQLTWTRIITLTFKAD
jgi:hypothetical protein